MAAAAAVQEHQRHMRNLFQENSGDFKIVVEGSEETGNLMVWEALIRKRSDVFDKMLTHDMAESRDKSLKLEGFTMEEVRCFFEFLYTGNAALSETNMVGLSVLADKYQMPSLNRLCSDWSEAHLSHESVAAFYLSSLRHQSATSLAEQILLYIDENAAKVMPHLHALPDEEVSKVLSRGSLCILEEELVDALVAWVENQHRTADKVLPLLQKHANISLLEPSVRGQVLPRLEKVGLKEWGTQASHAPARAVRTDAVLAILYTEYSQLKITNLPFLGYWVIVIPSRADLITDKSRLESLARGCPTSGTIMKKGDSLTFMTPHRRVRPISVRTMIADDLYGKSGGTQHEYPMSISGSLDGCTWLRLVGNTAECEPLRNRSSGSACRFACRTSQMFKWFRVEALASHKKEFWLLDVEGVVLPC